MNSLAFKEFLISLAVALVLCVIVALVTRKNARRTGFAWFFLFVFMATWAGGVWIRPLLVVLMFALFAPFKPPQSRQDTLDQLEEIARQNELHKLTYITLGAVFWVIFIILIIAVIARYIIGGL